MEPRGWENEIQDDICSPSFCFVSSFKKLAENISQNRQRDIYVNFLDFEKAFDSVHRTSLWKILRQYGIPQKIVNIITLFLQQFSTCCVQNSSSSFAVNSGVRQGCVMSSFLFIRVIDWIMKNGTERERTGIRWTLLTKRRPSTLFLVLENIQANCLQSLQIKSLTLLLNRSF